MREHAMTNLRQALWVELRKARRARMPLITALAFALAPLAGGFFMVVMKDPALARRLGMISAKAQFIAGGADWPTYFSLLAQAAAIGGFVLFSLIAAWVFGREYSDHTLKDLLALPTPRRSIVLAKFIVIALWALLLALEIYLLGLIVGTLVALPPVPPAVVMQGSRMLAETAGLTILLVTPIAFFAGVGRGYLAPMGGTILLIIAAQLVAAAGWGEYFPWAIPALHAGMAGPEAGQMGWVSYGLVLVTSLLGVLATLLWWEWADQTQ
jgi:ABC-2 type transport system permease protein